MLLGQQPRNGRRLAMRAAGTDYCGRTKLHRRGVAGMRMERNRSSPVIPAEAGIARR